MQNFQSNLGCPCQTLWVPLPVRLCISNPSLCSNEHVHSLLQMLPSKQCKFPGFWGSSVFFSECFQLNSVLELGRVGRHRPLLTLTDLSSAREKEPTEIQSVVPEKPWDNFFCYLQIIKLPSGRTPDCRTQPSQAQ